MRKLILLLIGFVIFLSCDEESNLINPPDEPPRIPKRTLEAAPETLKVAGQNIFLSTYMWRDFMPISPPNGHPLIALVYIQTVDSIDIVEEIDADAIYIINDDEIWKAYFTQEDTYDPYAPPKRLTKVARDGPKWGPHIFVDVVVNVIYESKSFLLKAEDQYISKTW